MGAVKRTHPDAVIDQKHGKWMGRVIREMGYCPPYVIWRPKHRKGFRDPVRGGIRIVFRSEACAGCRSSFENDKWRPLECISHINAGYCVRRAKGDKTLPALPEDYHK